MKINKYLHLKKKNGTRNCFYCKKIVRKVVRSAILSGNLVLSRQGALDIKTTDKRSKLMNKRFVSNRQK